MPAPRNLSTTYLGFHLPHPFMVGASPLVHDLDMVRRLEDAGCAAIVMHSLFEEQISEAQSGRIHHIDPHDEQFATVFAYFPHPDWYAMGPDGYLEQLRRIKGAVKVPVIASLNGARSEAWLTFAEQIEQAGADALELNLYDVAVEPRQSAISIEHDLIHTVRDLKEALTIPVAVKLSPFFTAFGHLARDLDGAGADGLVLFNRFYQSDFDIGHLTVVPKVELSGSSELLLRLRWVAALDGCVRASLALTGGVANATDGIKALLAGADAVQLVSAILRHGPAYFQVMRDGLLRWMDLHHFDSLEDVRGRLNLSNSPEPRAFERASYIRAVGSLNATAPKDAATPNAPDIEATQPRS